jgi:hypothetical protein
VFALNETQAERVRKWLADEVYPKHIEKQRSTWTDEFSRDVAQSSWDLGFPYEGAIGGGITYEFTPTSLGEVVKVRYGSEDVLDLTDYDEW